jgi:hypothetical protein
MATICAAGAIAAQAPVAAETVKAAGGGMPVWAFGDGFQVLAESHHFAWRFDSQLNTNTLFAATKVCGLKTLTPLGLQILNSTKKSRFL